MLSKPRNELCGSRPSSSCGKAAAVKEGERQKHFTVPPGYWHRHATKDVKRNKGSLAGGGFAFQLGSREGQARPVEMAERPVVAKKPGNSGGAKGPQFMDSARRSEGR